MNRWNYLCALVLGMGCSRVDSSGMPSESDLSGLPSRNWSSHPAIVQIDDADDIYALSDPHGGYDALGHLLEANHLITGFATDPSKADSATWSGGKAVLVVAGDLIDKGSESLGVIDLLRSLEKQAPAASGRVVVTLGNHEAEFFVDPSNKKATATGQDTTGIDNELLAKGIKPADLARGKDAAGRGAWLLNLPFGVRIKKWFFAHGGNTAGDSIDQLEKRLSHSVDKNGYGDKDVTGKDSILEAQEWYGDPDHDSTARKNADALGVKHIVFGHDPGAFKDHGRILANKDGSLVKVDVAMGLQLSGANTGGLILHVQTKGTDSAEVLDSRGGRQALLP